MGKVRLYLDRDESALVLVAIISHAQALRPNEPAVADTCLAIAHRLAYAIARRT